MNKDINTYHILKVIKENVILDEFEMKGFRSSVYIDIDSIVSKNLDILVKPILDKFNNVNFDSIGCPMGSALPVIGAIAFVMNSFTSSNISLFYTVNARDVIGKVGRKVVMFDNIIATGKTILQSIDILRTKYNCEIVKVVSLIDRLGGESIKYDFEYEYCFGLDDIF